MPGSKAHFLMEPPERRKYQDLRKIEERNPRRAGVMALFYPKADETHLLFILRKSYKGVHSNQIAFPGGKEEKEDNSMLETALRETEEEVGVPVHKVEVVKELSKLYIPPSNFWVQPYLGLYTEIEPFQKQESEVEDILEIPMRYVLNEDNLTSLKLNTSYAQGVEVPAFNFQGRVVWGATAMMLNEIKLLLKQVL